MYKAKSLDRALTIPESVGRAQSKKRVERTVAGGAPRRLNEALQKLGSKVSDWQSRLRTPFARAGVAALAHLKFIARTELSSAARGALTV